MTESTQRSSEQHQTLPYTVCALYKFISLDTLDELKTKLLTELNSNNIKGTLLIAHEGINGTIAGLQKNVDDFLTWLQQDERFEDIDYKLSYHLKAPFHRTKVKLKKEIVTIGLEEVDPNQTVGTYVEAQDWNEIISDPETVVIDTRNGYEINIGSFKNAVDPKTETFREFPEYIKNNLNPEKHKKVAMFCTGGIRCEKASSYMKQQGFEEVYHLKGGVLKYLETVAEEDSLWEGECFVFDDRVAVNHALEKGQYDQCHACRHPITEEQKQSKQYQAGVSCPRCYEHLTPEQKQRFSEREKQMNLAKQRGMDHIGSDAQQFAEKNRLLKLAKKQSQNAK